jgi:hypothetical protein
LPLPDFLEVTIYGVRMIAPPDISIEAPTAPAGGQWILLSYPGPLQLLNRRTIPPPPPEAAPRRQPWRLKFYRHLTFLKSLV